MLKQKFFILLILQLIFISSGFPQQKAGDVLKSLQDKFDTINDLQANITQSTDGKQNLAGKLLYKKKNKFRLELKNNLIISNGTTSWNYSKKENKVVISSVDDESTGIFSINDLVYKYPLECDVSLSEDEGYKVLILIPKTEALSFNYLKLFVNSDNLISKVVLSESANSLSQVNISDYVLNNKISDSNFNFIPPEGSKVIDLR